MRVQFFELTPDGSDEKLVGEIRLEDNKLVADPPTRLALSNVLAEPLFIYDKEERLKIDPKKDPKGFLKALPRAIRGSYFWAGPVEE